MKRFNHAKIPPRCKTTRIRGRIIKFIRDVARTHETFTAEALLPVLTRKQAETNLSAMARRGELVMISKGHSGHTFEMSVYARK